MCVVMNHIASMIKKKLSYFKQLNDVCLYLCSSLIKAIIITLLLGMTHKKTRAKFCQTMKNTLDYTVKRFQIYLMYVIMG